LRLFDERGVDNVSARGIAHEAGHRIVAVASHPTHFREVNVTFAASLLRAVEYIVPLV